LTGDIVDYNTPLKQIADWIEKTYLRKDYSGFTGDRKFLRDNDAQKAFSKLRSSIAGVYAWRLSPQCPPQFRPKTTEEYQRVLREAEFSFRQAFAFCPYSPEAVYRYINLLLPLNRFDEALLIAETCLKLDPYSGQMVGLVQNLRSYKGQQTGTPQPVGDLTALESEFRARPTNVSAALELARIYFQMQQTNRAAQVFDQALAASATTADALHLAQAAMQMGDRGRVEAALEKLVQVNADNPEAWYDLAAFKAESRKPDQVLPALSNALRLSSLRLKQNPAARDLLPEAKRDPRFEPLRPSPGFQQLVPQ
jgi:tetratricopeptide (TPR) repeat protein